MDELSENGRCIDVESAIARLSLEILLDQDRVRSSGSRCESCSVTNDLQKQSESLQVIKYFES